MGAVWAPFGSLMDRGRALSTPCLASAQRWSVTSAIVRACRGNRATAGMTGGTLRRSHCTAIGTGKPNGTPWAARGVGSRISVPRRGRGSSRRSPMIRCLRGVWAAPRLPPLRPLRWSLTMSVRLDWLSGTRTGKRAC